MLEIILDFDLYSICLQKDRCFVIVFIRGYLPRKRPMDRWITWLIPQYYRWISWVIPPPNSVFRWLAIFRYKKPPTQKKKHHKNHKKKKKTPEPNFLIKLFYYPNAITKLTTYPLGYNHYNPRYTLVHDNWLTSGISGLQWSSPMAQVVSVQ